MLVFRNVVVSGYNLALFSRWLRAAVQFLSFGGISMWSTFTGLFSDILAFLAKKVGGS